MKTTIASTLTLALLFLGSSLQAEPTRVPEPLPKGLFAHATLEQAWRSSVATNKPLLVMFTSDRCMYCTKMLKETYHNPTIEKMLSEHTQSVLAHSNDYRELVKKLGVRGYPSTLLISPQGEVLDYMEGFVDAPTFAARVYPVLRKRTSQSGNRSSTFAVNLSER